MTDNDNDKHENNIPKSSRKLAPRDWPFKWHREMKSRLCAVMACEENELPPFFLSKKVYPAKIGLREELIERLGDDVHPAQGKLLQVIMYNYTRSTQYSHALIEEEVRYDLDLRQIGSIDESTKERAQHHLEKFSTKKAS